MCGSRAVNPNRRVEPVESSVAFYEFHVFLGALRFTARTRRARRASKTLTEHQVFRSFACRPLVGEYAAR